MKTKKITAKGIQISDNLKQVFRDESTIIDRAVKDELTKAADIVFEGVNNALPLAVEFGYRQCEKGNNLEKALMEYAKLSGNTVKPKFKNELCTCAGMHTYLEIEKNECCICNKPIEK